MPAKHKHISRPGYNHFVVHIGDGGVSLRATGTEIHHKRVDLCRFKTGNFEIEPNFRENKLQLPKFESQSFAIPSSLFCKFVIGQAISTNFRVIEMRKSDDGDLLQAE